MHDSRRKCLKRKKHHNLQSNWLVRVGPLDPNENSGINASKSLDLQPFHLKDSQRRGQITSSHEQNGQVASIISIEPPQEDTVISSINHDTSFNIQQELVPVHTNPALNWLRSMLQQSISCCRPRYINNEDHVTCLKVYCTSIDPSHCYSVVQVTRSTTVQEVILKIAPRDVQRNCYLLFTHCLKSSYASLIPSQILKPYESLFPLHLEACTGRLELLCTKSSVIHSRKKIPPRRCINYGLKLHPILLLREPNRQRLIESVAMQVPILVDLADGSFAVIPIGTFGVYVGGPFPFPDIFAQTEHFCFRDETEEYNGVIFIFEPGYSLCIIPVFNNSSAVTLDGQQLTSPKNVNDCCRLTLNNSTNILIRTPWSLSMKLPNINYDSAGRIQWNSLYKDIHLNTDDTVDTVHDVKQEFSSNSENFENLGALKSSHEVKEISSDIDIQLDNENQECIKENLFDSTTQVSEAAAKRTFSRWRLLNKKMLKNQCDVNMKAIWRRQRKLRQCIPVRPILTAWLTLLSTIMAVEKTTARSIHSIFDSNNDGRLTRNDLYAVFKYFDLGFSPQDVNILFEFLDSNKDGFIDVIEFSRHVTVAQIPSEIFYTKKKRNESECVLANELISNISRDSITSPNSSTLSSPIQSTASSFFERLVHLNGALPSKSQESKSIGPFPQFNSSNDYQRTDFYENQNSIVPLSCNLELEPYCGANQSYKRLRNDFVDCDFRSNTSPREESCFGKSFIITT